MSLPAASVQRLWAEAGEDTETGGLRLTGTGTSVQTSDSFLVRPGAVISRSRAYTEFTLLT